MINELQRKNINVDKVNLLPFWVLKEQSDVVLKLALFKNSVAFDITGQTVKLGARTSQKTIIEQIDGFTISTNNLDIALKNSILVAGLVELEIELIDINGSMTTASFFILVDDKVLSDEAIQATNEFDTFTKTVDEIQAQWDLLKGGLLAEDKVVYFQNEVNEINSSLAEIETKKASKDEVFSMANMGQDIKTAMTGGSVAVVGINAVLETNVVDKQITPRKTNFFVPTRNKFDYTKATNTAVLNEGNGTTYTSSTTWYTSDYVLVVPNTNYKLFRITESFVAGSIFKHICYYDANKTFISSITNTSDNLTGFTTPANAYYIRFDENNYAIKNCMVCLETDFDNTLSLYDDVILGDNYKSVENNNYAQIISDNLYNYATTLTGKSINVNFGETLSLSDEASACVSDYIQCKPNKSYYLFIDGGGNCLAYTSNSCIVVYFDKLKRVIGAFRASATNHFITPSNSSIKYIRVKFENSYYTNFMLSETDKVGQPILKYNEKLYLNANEVLTLSALYGWFNKKWTHYGDSIGLGIWHTYVQNYYGLQTVKNLSVYGTTMIDNNTYMVVDSSGNIVQGDVNKDTYVLNTGESFAKRGFSCSDRINLIPIDTDLLTVMGGTNDFGQNVQFGDTTYQTSDFDITKFKGAIASAIVKMQTRCPNATIVFCTPFSARGNDISNMTSFVTNTLGFTTVDYANAMVEVCQEFSIPCIDIFGLSGINQFNRNAYMSDGVHPNAYGQKRLAKAMIMGLKTVIPYLT